MGHLSRLCVSQSVDNPEVATKHSVADLKALTKHNVGMRDPEAFTINSLNYIRTRTSLVFSERPELLDLAIACGVHPSSGSSIISARIHLLLPTPLRASDSGGGTGLSAMLT